MRMLTFLLLLALGVNARAADLDADGALARWLDIEGPRLAERLARHPRFAGATFEFVAVVDGAPVAASDGLREAVERRLRRHLLRVDGVRVALPAAGSACNRSAAELLIGIEIVARNSRRASVHIGVIDRVEGVWISGAAIDWRGQLAQSERVALATPQDVGSAAVPLADADAVAAALTAQLRCSWPSDLAGRVHLAGQDGASDAAVAAALRAELGRTPLVVVSDEALADWELQLELDRESVRPEMRLLLAPNDGRAPQRLATVVVQTGLTAPASAPTFADPAPIPVATAPRPAIEQAPGFLSVPRLEQVRREGICRRGGEDVLCAELALEVERPAWVYVLATSNGRARPLSCDPRPSRSDAGERRFRFAVGRVDADRPDTGVYVLATRTRSVAHRLAEVLRSAPGACGTRDSRPLDHWLADLADVLRRAADEVDWHAVHLMRDGDRVIRL